MVGEDRGGGGAVTPSKKEVNSTVVYNKLTNLTLKKFCRRAKSIAGDTAAAGTAP